MSTLNQKGIFASLLRSSSSELGSLSSTDVISGNTMPTACNKANPLDLAGRGEAIHCKETNAQPDRIKAMGRAPIESNRIQAIFDSYEYSLYSTNIRSSTNPRDLLI